MRQFLVGNGARFVDASAKLAGYLIIGRDVGNTAKVGRHEQLGHVSRGIQGKGLELPERCLDRPAIGPVLEAFRLVFAGVVLSCLVVLRHVQTLSKALVKAIRTLLALVPVLAGAAGPNCGYLHLI